MLAEILLLYNARLPKKISTRSSNIESHLSAGVRQTCYDFFIHIPSQTPSVSYHFSPAQTTPLQTVTCTTASSSPLFRNTHPLPLLTLHIPCSPIENLSPSTRTSTRPFATLQTISFELSLLSSELDAKLCFFPTSRVMTWNLVVPSEMPLG